MIEVEIRAKVNDFNDIRGSILHMGGKFISKEKQVDKIFSRKKDLDKDHKIIEGRFVARIRQKTNNVFVELKEIKRDGIGLEFSSPLNKIEDGVKFLSCLDFTESFTISKIRD